MVANGTVSLILLGECMIYDIKSGSDALYLCGREKLLTRGKEKLLTRGSNRGLLFAD